MLVFARHPQAGRISPRRVFVQVEYSDRTPEPADILRKIGAAQDIGSALDSFNPPHEGFRPLTRKLAELRTSAANASAAADEGPARIPEGSAIRPGGKDQRVPLLRERLHVRGKLDNIGYDRALYNAVRDFQHQHGLKLWALSTTRPSRSSTGRRAAERERGDRPR